MRLRLGCDASRLDRSPSQCGSGPLPKLFEELAYRETALGLLSLRRRRQLQLGIDVLDIKLGDEHLMSDLFVESEIALARLGIDATPRSGGDVVVGGLGLGYTAQAVLA